MADSLDILVALSVIFTALTIYYHLKLFSFWSSRGIKGPTPWPIFGTSIYYLFRSKLNNESKWRQEFGRTYGLYEGYRPLLHTDDAELVKSIHIKQFHRCTNRNDRFIFGDNATRWMFWSRDEHWANQRALVSPMFSASKMRVMMPTMSQCIDRFIERASETRKDSFDKLDLSNMTLDVIALSFFGLKIDTYSLAAQKDPFIRAAYRFADFDIPRFIIWLFVHSRISRFFKFDLFGAEKFRFFEELSQRIINERRSQKGKSKKNDLIQALLDARLKSDDEQVFSKLDDKEAHYSANIGQELMDKQQREQTEQAKHFRQFDDAEIRGQMVFLLLAGFETTASTLSFSLNELANKPKVQAKLLAELQQTFGERGEKLSNGKLDTDEDCYTDLLNCTHMDAFISEVLRLYSPILDNHRMVSHPDGLDIEINGNKVWLPKETPISTNSFLVHRDPEYFDRPEEFDETRFLPENKHKIKTGTFMPFGIGPRYCAGMRFALLEVKLGIAKFLLRFEVLPADQPEYPPKFLSNPVFLQSNKSNFKLVPRF